jgi:hypothetical protein
MCVTMEPESSSQNAVHLIPVKQEQDCGLTLSATVKGESEVSYTFVIDCVFTCGTLPFFDITRRT